MPADAPLNASDREDPRIERTRAHVLAQARELLAEGGAAAVTYSELAARARVTRQTLYRHWPTREALFVSLALDGAARGMPPSFGSPEEIIGAFLTAMRAGMDDPSNAASLTALIAQGDHDEASRVALAQIVADVRAGLNAVLEPVDVVIDADQYAQLTGPILFQRFFARERPSDDLIEDVVRTWSESRRSGTNARRPDRHR